MKKFLLVFGLLLSVHLFADAEIYKLKHYVNDYANVLTEPQKQEIESYLEAYDKNTTNQIVILIVQNIDGYTLDGYSIKTAESNGIGQKGKDNGVLMLYDMGDKKVRIEVGYGFEGALTDAKSAQIIRNVIVPRFREGQFYAGIKNGLNSVIAIVSPESAVQESSIAHTSTTASVQSPDAVKMSKSTLDLVFGIDGIVIVLLAFGALAYRLWSIAHYKLKRTNVFIFMLIFAVPIFAVMYLSDPAIEAALVTSFFIAFFIFMIFVVMLPPVLARMFGLGKQLEYLKSLNEASFRDRKLKRALKTFAQGKLSFGKYQFESQLLQNYDLLHSYQIENVEKGRTAVSEDIMKDETYKSADVYNVDISKDTEGRHYVYAVLAYKKTGGAPDIYGYEVLKEGFKIAGKKKYEDAKSMKTALAEELGIWAVVSGLSFATMSSSSGGGGFGGGGFGGGGGGFGGGGGGFGGGGASGGW